MGTQGISDGFPVELSIQPSRQLLRQMPRLRQEPSAAC
jgi:hypothetical protein